MREKIVASVKMGSSQDQYRKAGFIILEGDINQKRKSIKILTNSDLNGPVEYFTWEVVSPCMSYYPIK